MTQAFASRTRARRQRKARGKPMLQSVAPALYALLYPIFVDGFHLAVGASGSPLSPGGAILASAMLLLMFTVPAFGFLHILAIPRNTRTPPWAETRARRLSYATIAAPTLYCFLGVWQILLSSPLPDEGAWIAIWSIAIIYVLAAPAKANPAEWSSPSPTLRVIHGVTALALVLFVVFHLTNHLFAWGGEASHRAVMDLGRTVYRSRLGEPLLVAAMLFQTVTGLILAWRWSARRLDFYKTFQVASGFFLSVYIIGHMNSVFTYARWFLGVPTGWDFATGAPEGLIHDPWSARLIPHYALAIFLIVGHLFAGLRVVMIAHGATDTSTNRVWLSGLLLGGALSLAIMLAMCGMRI